MKHLLKILLSLLFLFQGYVHYAFAQQNTFDNFLSELKIMGITVDNILKQSAISRYDMVYLLNLAECVDCFYPQQPLVEKYQQNFWTDFVSLPGKYFNDIPFFQAPFNNKNYYYCVAYAGDQQYVNGYPQPTSPICGGKFCGFNTTTKAEFLQVIINIIGKYIYRNYSANWKSIKTYLDSLTPESYQYKNFNIQDRLTINSGANTCSQTSCPLMSTNELKAYTKYCMFNLKACNFQPFGGIKEGYWPVSELNILYKQGIITLEEGLKTDIGKSVNGEEVLRILLRLKEVTQCTFNKDNDCDGVLNQNDNCPNTYNPKQTDTDSDGKGDVCDDDIDGDGIKNPEGIVDDEGNINIKKYLINSTLTGEKLFSNSNIGSFDNCIFTKNPDQKGGKTLGQDCENGDNMVGLRINSSRISGSAPLTTTLTAFTEGKVKNIKRDLGNSSEKTGSPINVTFEKPGTYIIQAYAQGEANTAIAKQTIIVGENLDSYKGLEIRSSTLAGKAPFQTSFSLNITGTQNIFNRSFNSSKQTTTNTNLTVGKIFSIDSPTVIGVQSFENNKLAAVAQMNIETGPKAKGTILNVSNLRPKAGENITFNTTIKGFTSQDIESIQRDFNEGPKVNNKLLQVSKIFQNPGLKIINQTITLKNSQSFNNIITINILPREDISISKKTFLQPSRLSVNTNQNLQISNNLQNINNNNILRIIHEQGNGLGKVIYKNFGTNLGYSQRVNTKGVFSPRTFITLTTCQSLENQATIINPGINSCLLALQSKNLQNMCDQDKDGIPDMCDDDIDNDGIKNELGTILFDNANCSLSENNDTNINKSILNKHFQGVCSLDNCPFTKNENQSDLNSNKKGDTCENGDTTLNNGDSLNGDNERSLNYKNLLNGDIVSKLCPSINNVTNNISCPGPNCPTCPGPNCPANISCPGPNCPGVAGVNCLQCPCQFAGYDGDLADGDQIRAGLRDLQGITNYNYSLPQPLNR